MAFFPLSQYTQLKGPELNFLSINYTTMMSGMAHNYNFIWKFTNIQVMTVLKNNFGRYLN